MLFLSLLELEEVELKQWIISTASASKIFNKENMPSDMIWTRVPPLLKKQKKTPSDGFPVKNISE